MITVIPNKDEESVRRKSIARILFMLLGAASCGKDSTDGSRLCNPLDGNTLIDVSRTEDGREIVITSHNVVSPPETKNYHLFFGSPPRLIERKILGPQRLGASLWTFDFSVDDKAASAWFSLPLGMYDVMLIGNQSLSLTLADPQVLSSSESFFCL